MYRDLCLKPWKQKSAVLRESLTKNGKLCTQLVRPCRLIHRKVHRTTSAGASRCNAHENQLLFKIAISKGQFTTKFIGYLQDMAHLFFFRVYVQLFKQMKGGLTLCVPLPEVCGIDICCPEPKSKQLMLLQILGMRNRKDIVTNRKVWRMLDGTTHGF